MFDKKKEAVEVSSKPPLVNASLIKVFKSWQLRKGRSAHIPANPFEAAEFWIALQEPPDEYRDRPERQIDKNGDHTGWITPYHDRLIYNLRRFLAMPDIHKAFVVDRVRKGVPYRGDDIEFYKMVCAESEKMDDDKEGYLESAFKTLRQFKFGSAA